MLLVYTVNLDNYDDLRAYRFPDVNTRRVVFSYDKKLRVPGWETIVVERKKDVLKHSREIKINVHKFIEGHYEAYIYLDASYEVKRSLEDYANRYYRGGLLLFKHPTRKCVYKEALRVVEVGADIKENVFPQMRKYDAGGLPNDFGLSQNGFFIRDSSCNSFMEMWFMEIKAGSYRDQLSLPWIIFKHKTKLKKLVTADVAALNNRYLHNHVHAKGRNLSHIKNTKEQKVWYFTPGRGDKNLGKAYNDHCALVPDGDWICITDGDALFLNPYWSKQIEDIISTTGGKYALISCVTNRLGLKHQLPFGFSEDPNILNHAKIANDLYIRKYAEVEKVKTPTAGLFMLFPKSTWDKVKFKPGLTNNGTFVDFSFSNAVLKKFGYLGIASGIYMFHFYRFDKDNSKNWDHLKD